MKDKYQKTIYACFIGYVVQAVYTKFADVEMITGDKPFEELSGQLEEKLKTCVKNS